MDSICDRCTAAFAEILSQLEIKTTKPNEYEPIWVFHHPNVPSLRESAKAGCGVCKIVMTILRDMDLPDLCGSKQDDLGNSEDYWPYVAVAGEERFRRLRFYTDPLALESGAPSQRGAMRFQYYMYNTINKRQGHMCKGAPPWLRITQKNYVCPHLIGRETESWPQSELAVSWLNDCLRNHEACGGAGNGQNRLPTRVLELTVDESVASYRVKLVETKDLLEPAIGHYVALSHCWGLKPPQILTTNHTFSEHLRDITFQSLARNFQDAIRFTASLKIRYLWIDSLCIIQGDEQDWQNECSKMAATFQNATITIAAEGAPDAYAGFLHERKGPSGLSCNFVLPVKEACSIELTAMREDTDWHPFLGTERPPVLRQRGWVHQERLLSPRTLYFGNKQMYFECLTSQRFEEIYPPLAQRFSRASDYLQFSIRAPWLRGPDVGDLTASGAYNQYYNIVSDYSRCKLTKEDDRLAAISGIASRFQEYSNDEYLAGIWKGDVLRGLCWSCSETYFTSDEPYAKPKYLPPSWSWASCRHSVTWRAKDFMGNALLPTQFLNSDVRLVGVDKFGQVSGGELQLSGTVRKGFIAREPELKDLEGIPDTSKPEGLKAYLDMISKKPGNVRQSSLQLYEDENQHKPGLCWVYSDEPLFSSTEVRQKEVTCLLMDVKTATQNGKSWFVWVGLALESVPDRPGTFRRVGLLMRRTDDNMWLADASDSFSWIAGGERRSVCII